MKEHSGHAPNIEPITIPGRSTRATPARSPRAGRQAGNRRPCGNRPGIRALWQAPSGTPDSLSPFDPTRRTPDSAVRPRCDASANPRRADGRGHDGHRPSRSRPSTSCGWGSGPPAQHLAYAIDDTQRNDPDQPGPRCMRVSPPQHPSATQESEGRAGVTGRKATPATAVTQAKGPMRDVMRRATQLRQVPGTARQAHTLEERHHGQAQERDQQPAPALAPVQFGQHERGTQVGQQDEKDDRPRQHAARPGESAAS